jgi:CNT family concentrative nucleoside transporter
VGLLAIAWLMSAHRRIVPWRVVVWGLALQLLFGLFVLRTPVGAGFFDAVDHALHGVLDHAEEGSRFIFGNLVYNNVPLAAGTPGTNDPTDVTPGQVARSGAFFAFNVLTTIIFVSSLMTVLYHLGLMQWVVKGSAWIMHRTMGTSGAETVATAGNIFVGLMEAPLFVKPYIEGMTRSELMALMAGGFATVSGGTLAAYVGMLSPYYPGIAGHLIAASVMSAPAALVVAKLMIPETEEPRTASALVVSVDRPDVNVIDAAARGAAEGLRLALSVAAMLIAFLALLALLDALVGVAGGWLGIEGLSLSGLFGLALKPVAWMIGVPWSESALVGQLVGVKTVLNEFVAFLQLAELSEAGGALSPRSVTIATYALAGFANFGSVAMMIAGVGEIAPSRRHDLARLGLKAMVAGLLAALMTASVAAILI